MSMVQTWTLWQRMPPRYQLTSKCLLEDPDELVAIGNAPAERAATPRKSASPRPYSARSSPPLSSRSVNQKENFMLSSSVPETNQNEVKESLKNNQSKNFSFPKRGSDYINTVQKQRRVNSARRRLAEAPPTPSKTSTTQSSTEANHFATRAKTAPVFPVTSPEIFKARKSKMSDSSLQDAVTCKTVNNMKSKSVAETSKVDLFQFEDSKSVVSSSSGSAHQKSRDQEHKAKKYVVQDTSRATVYIDNGKVMYFGKSRHDLTQLLKTQSLRADRSNCFLAEIRRDYLRHPKYDRKTLKGTAISKTDTDPRLIAHERVDYNRRVEHILSYYDENLPESRLSHIRPTSGNIRIKSPKGGRMKGLSLTPANALQSRPPSRSPSPEPIEPLPNDFIRLNRQAKIHRRQFYLRTPGMQHGGTMAEMEKCRCSMCRMELQLALVTGGTQDIDLAIVAAANDAGLNGKSLGKNGSRKYSKDNEAKTVINEKAVPRRNGVKSNSQKVTFQKPDTEVKQETNKVHINCKLPEMTDMAVSESGFESSRTQDAASTHDEDVPNVET